MAESSLYPTSLDSTNLYEVVARLSTTLSADITASTTTIPLTATTGFPTQGYIVIDNETIKYISVSVGSVDATGGRGHAGTAAAHTDTTQVLVAVTAAVFNKLRAGMIAVQTKVGISGSTDTATLEYKIKNLPAQTSTTQVNNLNADLVDGIEGVTLGENSIVFTPLAFNFDNQASASLEEVAGTSIAPAYKHVLIGATQQADAVNFKMPRSYDGEALTLEYMFSAATASVTHDLGIRGIAAGNANTYNPSFGDVMYMGVQTASAISNVQTLATKEIAAVSLGFAASKICYLGLIGGTVTNNVRIHNVALRWNKG